MQWFHASTRGTVTRFSRIRCHRFYGIHRRRAAQLQAACTSRLAVVFWLSPRHLLGCSSFAPARLHADATGHEAERQSSSPASTETPSPPHAPLPSARRRVLLWIVGFSVLACNYASASRPSSSRKPPASASPRRLHHRAPWPSVGGTMMLAARTPTAPASAIGTSSLLPAPAAGFSSADSQPPPRHDRRHRHIMLSPPLSGRSLAPLHLLLGKELASASPHLMQSAFWALRRPLLDGIAKDLTGNDQRGSSPWPSHADLRRDHSTFAVLPCRATPAPAILR